MGSKTNSKIVYQHLIKNITINENADEIRAIALLLMDHFGASRSEVLAEKEIEIDFGKINEMVARINQYEPIQYILGEAYFFGRKFNVNRSVLIPRPETELLVQLIVEEKITSPIMLDIGTGSGCIPISLALEIPSAQVHALDISEGALSIAKANAKNLSTHVSFFQLDILKETPALSELDVIVSNPPYVTHKEKSAMNKNVLDYEPHLALFVEDNDPLQFYKVIAERSKYLLKRNGSIFVEINPQFGKEVAVLFQDQDFKTKIIKDMEGKDRVVKAIR
jgi:release factor glutamine methyltransferase